MLARNDQWRSSKPGGPELRTFNPKVVGSSPTGVRPDAHRCHLPIGEFHGTEDLESAVEMYGDAACIADDHAVVAVQDQGSDAPTRFIKDVSEIRGPRSAWVVGHPEQARGSLPLHTGTGF